MITGKNCQLQTCKLAVAHRQLPVTPERNVTDNSKYRVAAAVLPFDIWIKITGMNHFKIVPLPRELAIAIRTSGKDSAGNTVIEEIATGKGPCRVSLQPFTKGKDVRLLFSHNPFSKDNAFTQPGPIFISKEDVAPYGDVYKFPAAIKNDPESFPLTLIGYNLDQQMVFTQLVGTNDPDLLVEKIFNEREDVTYLHARNAEAGCFICKIERV